VTLALVVVNAMQKSGSTPLHEACAAGQLGMVGLLLDKGAKVDATDNVSDTSVSLQCQLQSMIVWGSTVSSSSLVLVGC
jgi:ankyrin repeat protein